MTVQQRVARFPEIPSLLPKDTAEREVRGPDCS